VAIGGESAGDNVLEIPKVGGATDGGECPRTSRNVCGGGGGGGAQTLPNRATGREHAVGGEPGGVRGNGGRVIPRGGGAGRAAGSSDDAALAP